MLNRSKLLQELQVVRDKLFFDCSSELVRARELWDQICNDPTFVYKVQESRTELLVPHWHEKLNTIYPVSTSAIPYQILSVDGSQVYPDRHQGTSCYLINIGSVLLTYGLEPNRVLLDTQPYVFAGEQREGDLSVESVNCRRHELELQAGLCLSKTLIKNDDTPTLLLVDGSLIFWHLESQDKEVKDRFLKQYLSLLQGFYEDNLLIAGYISLPKSKELVNLIRLALCNFSITHCPDFHSLDHLVDTSIARFFLHQGTRTQVFANQSPITQYYQNNLKPYFFYIDSGYEIARVEIPAWIAHDQTAVDTVAAIIMDQINKGFGFPVCVAEAHEQAVVKGPDREFFYHLIQKLGIEQRQRMVFSQKSMKKRKIGI